MTDTAFLALPQVMTRSGALGTGTELLCSTAAGGLSWFSPCRLLLGAVLCLKHKVLSYECP